MKGLPPLFRVSTLTALPSIVFNVTLGSWAYPVKVHAIIKANKQKRIFLFIVILTNL
jgi:hypothetical protein